MKIGLQKLLYSLIKSKNGEIFYHRELEQVCDKYHYRRSNAERRLRPSESGEKVETIFNEKGFIRGYKWIGEEKPEPKQAQVEDEVQQEMFVR